MSLAVVVWGLEGAGVSWHIDGGCPAGCVWGWVCGLADAVVQRGH